MREKLTSFGVKLFLLVSALLSAWYEDSIKIILKKILGSLF